MEWAGDGDRRREIEGETDATVADARSRRGERCLLVLGPPVPELMDVGPRVGTGRTAEVFALGADRVVKRFGEDVPREAAEREAAGARVAADAGLPVPTVHELAAVDGTPAIVYERVRGPTMRSRLFARSWTIRGHARRLARLHARLHAVRAPDLPPVRDRLERRIRESELGSAACGRVRSVLASLPEGGALCHGDLHPGNVLLADEPIVIDWLDAGRGPPAADAARTSLLLRFGGRADRGVHTVIGRLFRRWYLGHCCRLTGVSRDRIRDWELPVAAARLAEGVPEAPQLRSLVVTRLADGGASD